MTLFVQKTQINTLTKQEDSLYKNLSTTTYGTALATKTTDKLIKAPNINGGLYFSHRNYCGLGLLYKNGTFTLNTAYDGYGPDTRIARFNSDVDFTNWLARESGQGMSHYRKNFNNQTITKIKLDWFLDDKDNPRWNAYCAYLHAL